MQETSRERGVLIGMLYVLIGTGTALIASKEIYPMPLIVERIVFIVTTAAFHLRLYIDRTSSTVAPNKGPHGENPEPIVTATITATGSAPILHADDERLAEEGSIKGKTR